MINKLKSNPVILQWIKQYDALSSRDRLALRILAIVVAALIIYFGIWQSAQHYAQDQESLKNQQRDLLQFTMANKSDLAQLARQNRSNSSAPRLDSQQLVTSISSRAKRFGINLKRFEPSGDDKVKVWLEEASFNSVVRWLTDLKAALKVEVEQISLEKEDKPGLISARITLSS